MIIQFFILIFSILTISCNKPEPQPELRDKIYQDLIEQKGITEKTLIEVEKQVSENKKAMEESVPQTGQIKWSQKRYFESQANLDKLKQQIQYFEIKIKERAKYVRRNYMDKFEKGEIWDSEKESQEYMAEKKLRAAKMSWDIKQRLKDAGVSQESGEKSKSKEKKAEESGGH